MGKEQKADKGKGEVPNKKTKKTKVKLNKRDVAGMRTGDYKKGCSMHLVGCLS